MKLTIISLFPWSYNFVVRSFILVRLCWNEIRVTHATLPVMTHVDERYHKSHHEDTNNQVLGQISYRGLLEDHRRYHGDTSDATSDGSPRELLATLEDLIIIDALE